MKRLSELIMKYPILHAGIFVIVYFTWFTLLEKYAQPVLYIHSPLDDKIPFVKYFIVPYLLWFIYMMGMTLYFMFRSKVDYWNVTRYMFTGMIVALIIYTIIPNGLSLRPTLTGSDIFTQLIGTLYSKDTPTNVCPSLHVFNSIAMNSVIQRSEAFKHRRTVKTLSWILCILICMSTVFLKQHSIIDVFWGMVMAFIFYPLSYLPLRRTSASHSEDKIGVGMKHYW